VSVVVVIAGSSLCIRRHGRSEYAYVTVTYDTVGYART
jgi:hypothetical protein